jgi:hypothetical protein
LGQLIKVADNDVKLGKPGWRLRQLSRTVEAVEKVYDA